MLFLSNDVVRLLGPLLLDESPSIQREALGALRNISVSGRSNACFIMETVLYINMCISYQRKEDYSI